MTFVLNYTARVPTNSFSHAEQMHKTPNTLLQYRLQQKDLKRYCYNISAHHRINVICEIKFIIYIVQFFITQIGKRIRTQ